MHVILSFNMLMTYISFKFSSISWIYWLFPWILVACSNLQNKLVFYVQVNVFIELLSDASLSSWLRFYFFKQHKIFSTLWLFKGPYLFKLDYVLGSPQNLRLHSAVITKLHCPLRDLSEIFLFSICSFEWIFKRCLS